MYVKPPRLFLIRLDEPEEERLEAQFNPTEFEIALKAVYKDHAIPGMSHQLKQFSHTDNISLKFDLFFQVMDNPARLDPRQGLFTVDDRARAEAFLFSLCVPRGDISLARNRPPSVMVAWPGFLTFEAVMLDVSFKYTEFSARGQPTQVTASCSMSEIRDLRYTSTQAREQGWQRGDSQNASVALDVTPDQERGDTRADQVGDIPPDQELGGYAQGGPTEVIDPSFGDALGDYPLPGEAGELV